MALIAIGGGIFCFILAWLGFREKVPLNWFYRYHQTPTKKENPDFSFESRAYALYSLLTGIVITLIGLFPLYGKPWMQWSAGAGGILLVITAVVIGRAVGKRQNKRNSRKRKHTVSANKSDTDDEFSIMEVRIGALKGPIVLSGWAFIVAVLGLSVIVVWKIPEEYYDLRYLVPLLILWPVCRMLNRLLPKRTFSYRDGVFTVARGGKAVVWERKSVRKVAMDHPVLPDRIFFYRVGRKKPVGISMTGFRQDDLFGLPAKILRIVGTKVTDEEKQLFDDME